MTDLKTDFLHLLITNLNITKMNIKTLLFVPIIGVAITLTSCGGGQPTSSEATIETAVSEKVETNTATLDLSKGESIFKAKCMVCHQENGQGVEGAFPPLAGSDYLLADKNRAIKEVLAGKNGEVTVNGKKFNQVMPPNVLTDEEAMDVMNYVLNSWGNEGGTLSVEDVKAARSVK